MVLDGSVETTGRDGTTELAAADFPTGLFSTRLPAGSIATAVLVPHQPSDARFGYRRFLLREGEYPMTQSAVRLVATDGLIADVRVAIGGAGDRPRRVPEAEAHLAGRPLDASALEGFAEVVAANVHPSPDVRGSAWWKSRVIAATARRALEEALASST
jgi:CO/xanthine dehydrogenase FAD-binding subunit